MTAIQQAVPDVNRLIYYGQAPGKAKPAPRPAVQISTISTVLPETTDKNRATREILVPENRLPKVEEIEKMIQDNGYPFKSSIYKAVAHIVESDLN
jgi:hypothetical protein